MATQIWVNIGSGKVFYGIHLWAISQEVLMKLILYMFLKMRLFELQPWPPGSSELTLCLLVTVMSEYS